MKKTCFFFVICVFVTVLSAHGQTRKQLEASRKKLKTEIRKVNKLLFETQRKEKNALEDLKDLNQKISVRTAFINAIRLEANALSTEIETNEKTLATLETTLAGVKADYADMIFKSYKSKSQQNRTLFLLSSKSFYQAYKRLQYMNQYAAFRKKQGEEIVVQTEKVQKFTDSLQFKKQLKDTLLFSKKEQQLKIEGDKKVQEQLVSTIKKKEKRYKRSLLKKQRKEAKIAKKIDKLIRDAIARANKRRGAKKSSGFILSPAAKALAAKFAANKGKLPWPVAKGLVTRKFGVQPHPTIGGITINSTGLHIVTEKGATATCVFNGRVLGVQLLAEGKKAVLVQHGNYITAYNNLDTLYVKKGDEVRTGQSLGKIFTNKVTGKTTLVFVLFKNTLRLNPSSWILKR